MLVGAAYCAGVRRVRVALEAVPFVLCDCSATVTKYRSGGILEKQYLGFCQWRG